MDVVTSIFGGADTSGQDAQVSQNAKTLALQAALAEQARGDVSGILPVADVNRNLGLQAALDTLGTGTGQQISALQQGNVGAQNVLQAGFPQFQNAILGGDVDLSGLQQQPVNIDPSFLGAQLPQFQQVGGGNVPQTGSGAGTIDLSQIGGFNPSAQGGVLETIFGGDFNDPADIGGQNVESMSDAELSQGIEQNNFIANLGIPAVSQAARAAAFFMGLEQTSRSEASASAGGTDPSAPGGIAGSAGDAPSTGSGGHGPEFGGDGSFGL